MKNTSKYFQILHLDLFLTSNRLHHYIDYISSSGQLLRSTSNSRFLKLDDKASWWERSSIIHRMRLAPAVVPCVPCPPEGIAWRTWLWPSNPCCRAPAHSQAPAMYRCWGPKSVQRRRCCHDAMNESVPWTKASTVVPGLYRRNLMFHDFPQNPQNWIIHSISFNIDQLPLSITFPWI